MASALWQVGIAALGTAATIYPLHLLDESLESRKRKQLPTPPATPRDSKRIKLAAQAHRPNMAFAKRTRFGRRRRRRFPVRRNRVKRVLRSARRRRFRKSVQRIMLRKAETMKEHFTETSFNMSGGNGTTGMEMRIFAPWQASFSQGSASNQIHGSRIHLWKFMWRLHMKGLVAGDIHVQILFVKSDFQMDVTAANTDVNNEGQTISAATTTTTNPTQVAPNGNIPFFDVTASPGQFAGLSPVTKFNTDNISIIKKWDFKMHGFGVATTDPFIDTTLTFPFNKTVQIQETQETIDGVPRFFGPTGKGSHYSQYYIVMRTWAQDHISATDHLTVLHRGQIYWKED